MAAERTEDRADSGSTLATGASSLSGGAALAAGAAGACCVPVVAPMVVALLGAGGAAWAATLEPYRPYLLAGSAALLAYSFWTLYGRAPREIENRGSSRTRWKRRVAYGVTWGAAVLWVAALALHFLAN